MYLQFQIENYYLLLERKKKKKFAWQHFISGFQCFTDGGKIICLWKLQNHTIKFYVGLITMLPTKTFYENYKSAW